MSNDVEDVFELWRSYRPSPSLCRLTPPRRKLIKTRLKSYSSKDLCVLIKYAFESESSEARFWRGENNRRQEYTGLTNLFRVTKIDDRLERALLWDADENRDSREEEAGIDLGPMGMWS